MSFLNEEVLDGKEEEYGRRIPKSQKVVVRDSNWSPLISSHSSSKIRRSFPKTLNTLDSRPLEHSLWKALSDRSYQLSLCSQAKALIDRTSGQIELVLELVFITRTYLTLAHTKVPKSPVSATWFCGATFLIQIHASTRAAIYQRNTTELINYF